MIYIICRLVRLNLLNRQFNVSDKHGCTGKGAFTKNLTHNPSREKNQKANS